MPQLHAKLSRAVWLLLAVAVIGWAGRLVMPFITLYMTSYVGLSVAGAAVIMSLFGLGGIVAVLVAGWLIDRFGAIVVMFAAILGTGCFALLVAMAETRVLQVSVLILLLGFCSQAMAPAFNALIATLVPSTRLRSIYSLMYMCMNIGFMLSPLLGGWAMQASYRLLFVVEASLMAIAALFTIPILLRYRQGAVAPSMYSSKQAAAITDSLPIVRPGGFKQVFSDRVFMIMCGLNIVYMMIYMQPQITLPVIMREEGYTIAQYGMLLSFNGALVVVFQLLADRLGRRASEGRLLALAMLITGVGVTGHLFGTTIWIQALCVMIWTAGELLNMPVATNVAAQIAPQHLRGRYMGVFTTSTNFANFLGPLIGGGVLSLFGPTGLWLGCGALALFAFLGRVWNAPSVDARMKDRPRP